MSDDTTLKVSEIVPALTARARLGQILDRVSENGERFLINKHGAPAAVVLSIEDYARSILKEPELLDKLQELHQKARDACLDKLAMSEIDAEIEATRKELKKSQK